MLRSKHWLKLLSTCNGCRVLFISLIRYVWMSRCIVKLLGWVGIDSLRWAREWAVDRVVRLCWYSSSSSSWGIEYLRLVYFKLFVSKWVYVSLLLGVAYMLHLELVNLFILFIDMSHLWLIIVIVVVVCIGDR